MKKFLILVLSFAILSGCGESPKSGSGGEFKQPFTQMLVYPKKNPIVDFKLQRHDQVEFNGASFEKHWNLIFMGYTNCPDVCPTTLMDMTNIYKAIEPELQQKFQVIFLSVDPARDNLEHIGNYIDHFHDDFVGVTGQKEEIDKLVSALGGIYSLNDEDEKFYSVDHTARIFIVSPKGERFGIVRSEAMHNQDKTKLVAELNELAGS